MHIYSDLKSCSRWAVVTKLLNNYPGCGLPTAVHQFLISQTLLPSSGAKRNNINKFIASPCTQRPCDCFMRRELGVEKNGETWGGKKSEHTQPAPVKSSFIWRFLTSFYYPDYSKFGSTEVTRKEEGKESPVFCSQISLLLSNRGLGKGCVISNCSAYV